MNLVSAQPPSPPKPHFALYTVGSYTKPAVAEIKAGHTWGVAPCGI